MNTIDIASRPAPLTRDEQRWLAAYRNMAVECRHGTMCGVEGVARAFPRVPEPHLRIVAGNRAASPRTEPR